MAGAPGGPRPGAAVAPATAADEDTRGGPVSSPGDGPAARWLVAFEALAARAAHEINNALNGAAMNLEVVRLRARPGADAGAVAPFAEAAASQLDASVALVRALLALARAPREGRDEGAELGGIVRDVVTLLAPIVAHQGITLRAELGGEPVRVGCEARVARLAVVSLLVRAATLASATARGEPAPPAVPAEPGGADRADEPETTLRCTVFADGAPTLRVTGPGLGAAPSPDVPDSALGAIFQGAGIHVASHGLALRFPPGGG